MHPTILIGNSNLSCNKLLEPTQTKKIDSMQPDITETNSTELFWSRKYQLQTTGWDVGYPTTPIKEYIDQLENKGLRILLPGAGNAYEAEYFFQNGFLNVTVLDIALEPLNKFAERLPGFPRENLLQANFFEHEGQYDLIIEHTFFCSFPPSADNRMAYAKKMSELLAPEGKLVGLWFTFPLDQFKGRPPYGGSIEEYKQYFDPYFLIKIFEEAYNSIKPRQENEAFGILQKR